VNITWTPATRPRTLVRTSLHQFGIALITPPAGGHSPQARAGDGSTGLFSIDFDHRHATCPQGPSQLFLTPVTQRGRDMIVIKFAASTCKPCPVRPGAPPPHDTAAISACPARDLQRSTHHPNHPENPDWQTKYAFTRRCRRRHPPRCRRHRPTPHPLPRTGQNPPATRVLRSRSQPDPPQRLLERSPLNRTRTSHLSRLEPTSPHKPQLTSRVPAAINPSADQIPAGIKPSAAINEVRQRKNNLRPGDQPPAATTRAATTRSVHETQHPTKANGPRPHRR